MGNQNNKYSSSDFPLAQFQLIREEKTTNTLFLEDKNTHLEYCIRDYNMGTSADADHMLQDIQHKKRILAGCPLHLLQLAQQARNSGSQFCTNINKITILSEYPQRTLDDETSQRHLQKRRYTEKTLWTILASCILALSHLQKNRVKHECLTSSQIFLQCSGTIKIGDPFLTASTPNYLLVQNRNIQNQGHIYLAPQIVQTLEGETYLNALNYDPYKADVFTLGMIMLETGLMEYQDECYRDNYTTISWQKIRDNTQLFKSLYSSELYKILMFMLERQPHLRESWVELQRYVKTINTGETPRKGSEAGSVKNGETPIRRLAPNNNPKDLSIQNPQALLESHAPHFGQNNQNGTPRNRQIRSLRGSPRHSPSREQQTTTFKQPGHVPLVTFSQTPTSMHRLQQQPVQIMEFPRERSGSFNVVNGATVVNQPVQNYAFTKISHNNNPSIIQSYSLTPRIMIPQQNYWHSAQAQQLSPRPGLQTILPNQSLFQKSSESTKFFRYPTVRGRPSSNFTPPLTGAVPSLQNDNITPASPNRNFPSPQPQPKQSEVSINRNINDKTHRLQKVASIAKNIAEVASSGNMDAVRQNQLESSFAFKRTVSLNDPSEKSEFVNQKYEQGCSYEGYKLRNKKHGNGKFYFMDGGMYDGQWENDCMSGYGKLFYKSGKLAYEGMWLKNNFWGYGVLFNEEPVAHQGPFDYQDFNKLDQYWTSYEGEFNCNMKEGRGKLVLSNGEYYEGEFEEDAVHGYGRFHISDGQVVKGDWQKNSLVSRFTP